jgi:predicted Abi (CAAX) family protease
MKLFAKGLLLFIMIFLLCLSSFSSLALAMDYLPSSRENSVAIYPPLPSLNLASLESLPGGEYRYNGEWIGKPILPTIPEIESSQTNLPASDCPPDWVWIEIRHAPDRQKSLIGNKVKLTWQKGSEIEKDSCRVTGDIKFTEATIESQKKGILHPERLNGRSGVGSLQSLAGARKNDDVLVRLDEVRTIVTNTGDLTTLTISQEPMQITGELRGLVKMVDRADPPAAEANATTSCPGGGSCESEYFQVRHYRLASRQFDGQLETIRIPQIPAKSNGLFPSSIRELANSPAGNLGWYISGDRDAKGTFTVEAIEPRSLYSLATQPPPKENGVGYLDREHWQNTPQQKGRLKRVDLNSTNQPPQLGDKALLLHLFGGIGGNPADVPGVWKTVTGHFAFGVATVVRDEFTEELRWQVEYNQVYAHNSDGIIAGRQDWLTYMGSLARGWLGTRPVADMLVSDPAIADDYNFDGITISPLTELQRQLYIIAARYRTGDGTGSASVTPATSCVQDANQALFATIRQINQQVRSQPQIAAWLQTHPDDDSTRRFQKLVTLGKDLDEYLLPLGIVRRDWQTNTEKLAGIADRRFSSESNPLAGLLTWRTMLPRGTQDGLAKLFLNRGAKISVFDTYQVGGIHPDIQPVAPTILFGEIPLLSKTIVRLWAGISTLPTIADWTIAATTLLIYGTIAILIGRSTKFLSLNLPNSLKELLKPSIIQQLAKLFILPAFVEEIIFRCLLIPHPIETAIATEIWRSSIVSLILFIIYHPLNAFTFYPPGKQTFIDWRFLTLAGLLGIACTIAYLLTSSLWVSIVIHWLVVFTWLEFLGGKNRLTTFDN